MSIITNSETAGIQLATNREQICSCYKIMHQLRPHITTEQSFVEQVQRQIKSGYHLAYIQEDGLVKAVTGFRFLEFLAWGKVIYIDDLVSDITSRRNGYGAKILKWIINQAKEAECDQVHLDSGPQRHDAHRLYLNHGFKIIGHHFSLNLNPGI
jgi:GNAT superfamily N-acetyltransferase